MSGDKRRRAKMLLKHYFKMLADRTGMRMDGDNWAELDDLVDLIMDGSIEQALNQHYLEGQQRAATLQRTDDGG